MTKISNSILTLTVAALVASAPLAVEEAKAGGGVRVGFGFPLGTFVASPNGPSSPYGSSGGHGQASKKAAAIAAHKKAAAAKQQAALAAQQREAAARKAAALEAKRQHEIALAKAAQEKIAARRAADSAAATQTAALDTKTYSEPESGSKALSAGRLPPAEELKVAAIVPEETITAVDAPDAETAKTDTTATEAEPKVVASSEPEECKKFIPAVGVTITVGCNE